MKIKTITEKEKVVVIIIIIIIIIILTVVVVVVVIIIIAITIIVIMTCPCSISFAIHVWLRMEPIFVMSSDGKLASYLEEVYLVTAFVPSETACFASSPGKRRRTAV